MPRGLDYAPGAQPRQASTAFLAGNLTVEESVSSLPGTANSVVNQFRQAANACHSADIDNARMSVTPVALRGIDGIDGIDESAGVLMQGPMRGKMFAVEFGMVRIGDSVVGLSVFAEGPPNTAGTTLQGLMPLAIERFRRTH